MRTDPESAADAMRARLTVLLGREVRLQPHLRGEDGRREVDAQDLAAWEANDAVLARLDDAARDEVREIRAAFDRLAEGTWGACEACGEDIGAERLAVLPHARRCVACAATDER